MKRIALLSLLVPALLSAQVPDYVPTNGLVSYYPLDEVGQGHFPFSFNR